MMTSLILLNACNCWVKDFLPLTLRTNFKIFFIETERTEMQIQIKKEANQILPQSRGRSLKLNLSKKLLKILTKNRKNWTNKKKKNLRLFLMSTNSTKKILIICLTFCLNWKRNISMKYSEIILRASDLSKSCLYIV